MPTNKSHYIHILKKEKGGLAHYSVLAIIILSLLESIKNIERETIIPFIPPTLVVTLLGSTLLLALTRRISIKTLNSRLFIGINCFSALILISTLYSKYPQLTVSRSLQFFIVTNCLFFILSCVKDTKNIFEKTAKITITFTLVASLYGIVLYHFGTIYSIDGIWVSGIKFYEVELNQRLYGHRISSFLGNPNPFGIRIIISALACLYFITKYKSKWCGLFFLIFLYTLLLTGSRASVLGLMAGVAIFLNFYCMKENLGVTALRILIIGFVLIIGGYLFIAPEIIKDVFSLMGRASNTLSGRELAWAALLEQIKETPYFGIGYRISTEAVLEDNLINVSNSHNLYLSIASEIGIFGILLFSYIFISPICKSLLSIERDKDSLQLISICIITSLLVNQAFEDMFAPLNYFFINIFLFLFIVYKNTYINKYN